MLALDYSRFTKRCYNLAVDAIQIIHNFAVSDAKIESKIKTAETPPVEILWTTMRIERKECSTTRRQKAGSGSPFKNWLINGSFDGVTIMMRTSHAIYNGLHVDVWYDFKVQLAKIALPFAPYWIVEVRENRRDAKISLLEDVGIVAELAHLILEYSFPTTARIAIRPRTRQYRAPTVALLPISEQKWRETQSTKDPDADQNSVKSKALRSGSASIKLKMMH